MNKLLKLSNIAINVSHISVIHITKNKYTIHINNFRTDGFMMFGSGWLDTYEKIVEVNKDNHPDYFKVSEYILRHSI
jgi:hypothetical protein